MNFPRLVSVAAWVMALLFSTSAHSLENFFNPLAPYPPGCTTNFMTQGFFYPGSAEILVDGDILINSTTETSAVTARLTIYRSGCAESGRSVVWIALSIQDDGDGVDEFGIVPFFHAERGDDIFPLRPTEEPSGWVSNDSGVGLAEGTMRYYVLDVPTPLSTGFDAGFLFLPSMYNGGFTLLIDNPDTTADYTSEITAYNDELQPAFIPFNGRLSGIWVVEGAADQGFVISFSELPGNDTQGLIFFSWYTFDETGNNVWLVGNATYVAGEGTISFELQLVTDGAFMGSKTATRLAVGNVQVMAIHCNLLELNYDLSAIGLGQAVVSLVRIVGLETAGFTCMDHEAKG